MRIVRLVVFGLLAAILLAATSSPVDVVHDVVHKAALSGGVNSAPVSVIGKAAMVGPANSTSISVISRSVLGGPLEDLISAVIAATRGRRLSWWNIEHTFADGSANHGFGGSVSVDG
ncbi:MAG: hypothetical protein VX908_00280, partial [Planctomycetota bacterium]|nr:hypothetical protein [Planctomycetota bacterium]